MKHTKKIMVTGAAGQLGNELRELAAVLADYRFSFFDREEFSLTDSDVLAATIVQEKPDFLINCAAYTAVDLAESNRDDAFAVNATAVGVMAKTCARISAHFLHLSTDYVFDGIQRTPLTEDSPAAPLNVYGESKLAGERLALENNPGAVIIRTSWVYSFYGKNFVKTMMRLMAEKESLSVVNDQWGSPTYAADLAAAILQVIGSANWQPGIYHYSNEGVITWFDFASEIGRFLQTKCVVLPTTTASFPTPAKRPLFSAMDKSKIEQTYGVVLKDWKTSLALCLTKLQAAANLA